MTKIEYLKQLEDELRYKISEQEMYDIMRDYAEYFEEGKKQGKTDNQIIEALGIPYVVAKQILGETPDEINTTIKKSTANIKSSFNSFKDNAKNKYQEHKEKSSEKKATKEQFKKENPPKVKPQRKRGLFVGVCSAMLKLALWLFLFIPLIVSVGATAIALIIGSIAGIGFLSAFSFTVSTYSIFTASLVFLCLLFGGATLIFALIWFIKYLLGISDIEKQQYAFEGNNPNMNYRNYNPQNPNNNFYNNQANTMNNQNTNENVSNDNTMNNPIANDNTSNNNTTNEETMDSKEDNQENNSSFENTSETPFKVTIKDESILNRQDEPTTEIHKEEEK